ncbi:hypothetical protein [Alkalihalobacillus sp. LMS39]|nr:hypothetical protein [Alkalihalobacillus sp. LMS39]UOE92151.1 hypothetical protein MM271_12850 [Alkalihalobacillus sp. LMS39]
MMSALKERVETVKLKSQRQINEERRKQREKRIAQAKLDVEMLRKHKK